jgi:peptidoglycan/LPS O-acetylase OafA/YrhL
MPPAREARSEHLPTLDGWRAVAIALVLYCHLVFNRGIGPDPQYVGGMIRFGCGQLGVAIFFGLSGLLITTRLLGEWDARGAAVLRPFYLRRFFRIIPAAYLYLLVAALLAALGAIPFEWQGLASAALFITNYNGYRAMPVGFFWSLAIEEHFYLLYPGFLRLLGPRRRLAGTLLAAALVVAWRLIEAGEHFVRLNPERLWQHTDCRLDGLLAGAAMAMLLRDPARRAILQRWLRAPVLWVLLSVLALTALPLYTEETNETLRTLCIPLVLARTILYPRSLLSRLLELPPLAWIGKVSYGLYLWNRLLFELQPWRWHPANAYLDTFLNLALLLAVVSLSYYLIERPLLGVGRRLALHERSR